MAKISFLEWLIGIVLFGGLLGNALIKSLSGSTIDWSQVFVILFFLWIVYEAFIKKSS